MCRLGCLKDGLVWLRGLSKGQSTQDSREGGEREWGMRENQRGGYKEGGRVGGGGGEAALREGAGGGR